MEYTAVIRTLGKAGEKYHKLLDSLVSQTVKPKQIIVYIAEGYPIPKETVGIERYVYVKKGMVAQRALHYDEVDTEYILFLDDDVFLPDNAVDTLYNEMMDFDANVISPDVFPNAERPRVSAFLMAVSGRMRARNDDGKWAYKVMRTGGYSYNTHPESPVYLSQTNAGPCFFCRKSTFIDCKFEEEEWLDNMPYAMGDDQALFYKMYLKGYKVLTSFDSGIKHLDAGSTLKDSSKEKTRVFCDTYFKTIFWHRFIYSTEKSALMKLWDIICTIYYHAFSLMISIVKLQGEFFKIKFSALREAISFLGSDVYRTIPRVTK